MYLDSLENDNGPDYSKQMDETDIRFEGRVSDVVKEIGQSVGDQEGKKLS